MATDTTASYATPPRSDAEGEDIEKINNEPLAASVETQTSTYNPMFVTDDEPMPTPPSTEPQHSMQVIDASDKRGMALDSMETVLTKEMDDRATTSGGYKRTTYLKEIKDETEETAEAWRFSDADVRAAQVVFQKTKKNPVDFLAARNTLHMARMEMESRREIRHAEDANYEAHRNKAQRLLAQRKTEEAAAKEAEVTRKQEAKRAKQERRDEELLRKSRDRIQKGRVAKRR